MDSQFDAYLDVRCAECISACEDGQIEQCCVACKVICFVYGQQVVWHAIGVHYTNALHVKLNQVHFVALKRNDLFDVKEDTGAMLVVYRASKSSRVVLVAQFVICLSIRTIGHTACILVLLCFSIHMWNMWDIACGVTASQWRYHWCWIAGMLHKLIWSAL